MSDSSSLNREREIDEIAQAMIKHLADLSGDIEAQHEVVERLLQYLALIEKSQLPEIEVNQ
jgi:hypothetical protein